LFPDGVDLEPGPDDWPDDEPPRRPPRWVQVVAVVLVAAVVGGSIWFTVSAVREQAAADAATATAAANAANAANAAGSASRDLLAASI
jgi:hypothetical protein